mgnify:CR=1 FL=1|jgi:hypothetical protein
MLSWYLTKSSSKLFYIGAVSPASGCKYSPTFDCVSKASRQLRQNMRSLSLTGILHSMQRRVNEPRSAALCEEDVSEASIRKNCVDAWWGLIYLLRGCRTSLVARVVEPQVRGHLLTAGLIVRGSSEPSQVLEFFRSSKNLCSRDWTMKSSSSSFVSLLRSGSFVKSGVWS